ncbi:MULTISPECIES: acetolactate synthase small subunit [Bacillaceae]|jgi:acetolactate synthase I/III small subunit|uniref:acetolactate synthase small subunit n=1 Tax=Bacillaceae TaxID=186817 RepID=UPI00177FFE55|nr:MULTISPECIES: acetolactate synthase small subunit [Bacillaceae]MBT2636316.1 acetolactate synthase small subunit [Bacillus sp. ISL-39]MBT2643061.1 acetolactate synthase small subunit [Bacillus sp. ISL-41]MBT2660598.1 acetolactate synthase small subunit [Bacillus sp. ISL-45]MCM3572098.1 acetolactate synthase small subunit [Mesobacillus subterraneus]UYZ20964.1 acetolactate synthase small subunit [Mesobacillus jeotgali]
MKRIITMTVLNRPGVLNRITNLFSKRNYNIESISVGLTEQEGVSRITCVVHVENDGMVEQITKQLNKQIDVLKVADISDQAIVARELILMKVPVLPHNRAEIYSIIEPFRASVIDVSKDSIIIQLTGETEKIEAFIDLIKPYGIRELARTGTTAFPRGNQRTGQQKTFSFV